MILARSMVPHAWRQALALFSVTVWLMLSMYLLIDGPLLHLLRAGWWGDYPTGQISG